MAEMKEVIGEVVPEQGGNAWGKPIASYKITFDSQQAQLEPIYYWILDFMGDLGFKGIEKVTDNFMSSPGSGHFADMNQRATRLQEEGMKMMGALNQVVKSVLNLIYDLKEFELRLKHYDDAEAEQRSKREEGLLALKQIWLDNVDLKKGRGSIHQMANELGFTTIREAFMMANSQEDLEKMRSDEGGGVINDQVYRILVPRLKEFLDWIGYSGKELRKRMEIEKSYLKSQVETIKLYSSWMKPYLRAAAQLKQQGFEGNAALVNAFSTSMFELSLFAKKEVDTPEKFGAYNPRRKYYACVMVNLKYRGHVSQRVTQRGDYGYAMGGRVEMVFDCFALNEEELGLVKKKLDEENVGELLEFEGDLALEALEQLRDDLDYFLGKNKKVEEAEKKKKEAQRKADDINPFSAIWDLVKSIFTGFSKKKDKKEISSKEDISKDNYIEKAMRSEAASTASGLLYTLYDVYKKVHGMASTTDKFQNAPEEMLEEPDVTFGDVFKGRERS